MKKFAFFDAQNCLSELIDRMEAGEEIAITRRGKVVARLVPPTEDAGQLARKVVTALRSSRKGVSLGGLSIRALVREGRR
jgi:prevent-host-death family protein